MRAILLSRSSRTLDVVTDSLKSIGFATVLCVRSWQELSELGPGQGALGQALLLVDGELQDVWQTSLPDTEAVAHSLRLWISPGSLPARAPTGFHLALPRPFGSRRLLDSVHAAFESQFAARSTLAWVGEKAPEIDLTGTGWGAIRLFRSPRDLLKLSPSELQVLGALVLDPAAVSERDLSGLRNFRRSATGLSMLWTCPETDAAGVSKVRTLCDAFTARLAGAEARTELGLLSLRRDRSFELISGKRIIQRALRDNEAAAAVSVAQRLASRIPLCWEVHGLLAEVRLGQGQSRRAREAIERALAINPCSPRLYARLLALLETGSPEHSRWASLAQAYCPGKSGELGLGPASDAGMGESAGRKAQLTAVASP